MKTIYGLYWKTLEMHDEVVVSTYWLETLTAAKAEYLSLRKQGTEDVVLFSFEAEDDATEEDINETMDDLILGRLHLVDMNTTVLQ